MESSVLLPGPIWVSSGEGDNVSLKILCNSCGLIITDPNYITLVFSSDNNNTVSPREDYHTSDFQTRVTRLLNQIQAGNVTNIHVNYMF